MKKGVIVGIVSSLLLVISMWLPAMDVDGSTGSFMDATAIHTDISSFIWGIVFIGIIMAVFAFINKKVTDIIGIVFAVLTLLIGLLLMSVAQDAADDTNAILAQTGEPEEVGVGFGIYAMIFGCIGAIVGYIMNLAGRKRA
ncbi:MAG: FtsH-binding integral membrane protein [Crocinitomicaceae bacterium]|jgi:FtsH-binding integral membrane protein